MTSTPRTASRPSQPHKRSEGPARRLLTLPPRTTGLIVLAVGGYLAVAGPGAVVLQMLARFVAPRELVPLVAHLLGQTLLLYVLFRVINAKDWWELAGLLPIPRPRRLLAEHPVLLVALLGLAGGLLAQTIRMATGELSALGRAAVAHSSTATVVILVGETMLLVGINEEVLFRGLALGALLRDRQATRPHVYQAVLTVSVLFGLAHLIRQAPISTRLTLAASTAAFGVLYSGVRLASGTIWVGLAAHGLWDATLTLRTFASSKAVADAAGPARWSQTTVTIVLLLGIGVGLIEASLRDHNPQPARPDR
jgi:membrane protease YdiL (CAAX protease family)